MCHFFFSLESSCPSGTFLHLTGCCCSRSWGGGWWERVLLSCGGQSQGPGSLLSPPTSPSAHGKVRNLPPCQAAQLRSDPLVSWRWAINFKGGVLGRVGKNELDGSQPRALESELGGWMWLRNLHCSKLLVCS
jgi:hypothetical protein